MNYNRFFIIVFLSAFFNHLQAELPFIYLKDLYNKVSKDYKHLSPVNGFHWWKLGIIENLYRFGDQNDETVKLIRELFYLQPWDNITFDITTLDNKPAKYLTSRTIGKILAFFEANVPAEFTEKNEAEFKESLKKVIKDDLQFSTLMAQAQKKKEQHELQLVQLPQRMSEIDAELKRLAKSKQQTEKFLRYKQKNLDEMIGAGTSREKIAQLTESIKSDQNILDSINQKINQFTGYKEKFGEFGQMRKQITQDIAKENLTEKSLDRFIEHLVGCYKESLVSPNQQYPKFTFHQIMLGFLWKKVQQKPELVDYFAAFFNYNIPIIASSELVSGKIPEWLSETSKYTIDYFEQYKKQLPNENLAFLLNNYELVSFLLYGYIALGDLILPPIISSIANTRYKNYQFPDCVETSIRNFINIAIFDTFKNSLDINALPKTATNEQFPLQPTQPLIQFYKKNNRVETIDSDILHNEWAQVVSELSGVNYRIASICNIASSAYNIFKIFNHLFFENSAAFDVLSNSQKLNIICKRLSSNGTNFSWQADENIDTKDSEFTLNFSFIKEGTSENFKWQIRSAHSVISEPPIVRIHLIKLINELARELFSKPESYQIINLLGWIIQFKTIQEIMRYIPYIPELILPLEILINAQSLKNNEIKDELIEILLNSAHATTQLDRFIEQLIISLPTDQHFQDKLLNYLIAAPERYYKFISPAINTALDEPTKKYFIIKLIMLSKGRITDQLKHIIENETKSLRSLGGINQIFEAISYFKIRNLDSVLLKNFDKIQFYEGAATFIYALKLLFEQETINEVLKKQIQEKFKELLKLVEHGEINTAELDQLVELLIKNDTKITNFNVLKNLIEKLIEQTQPLELQFRIQTIVHLIVKQKAEQLYPIAKELLEKQMKQMPTAESEELYKTLLERQQQ